MLRPVAVVLLMLVGGCTDEIAWRTPADEATYAEMQADPVIAAPVFAYLACIKDRSVSTPNGKEMLDLDRVHAVMAACADEETSARTAFARQLAEEDGAGKNESRSRVLREHAVALIRHTPYQPAVITPDLTPITDLGLRPRVIETAPLPLR